MSAEIHWAHFICEMNHSDVPQPGEVRVEGSIVERALTDADVRSLREGAEMPVDRLGARLKPVVDDTTKSFLRVLQAPPPSDTGDEDELETGGECL